MWGPGATNRSVNNVWHGVKKKTVDLLLPEQQVREFVDAADTYHLHVGADFGGIRLRQDHAAESEGGGFAGAEIGLRHAADLTEQANLAEDDHVMRDGDVALRREERRDHAEVDGRLVDLQTAGEIDVDIAGQEVAAVLLF